jgi:large subunit ribosomal protein L10
MALYTHHLPQWKRDEVEEIKRRAKEYTLLSLVDVRGIPAAQLQAIRRDLHATAYMKMTRNTLITQAIRELGGDLVALEPHVTGQSALVFTNSNPFRLFKMLEKTKMAAKPGEIAPVDIVVEKGPTSFKPGPIVGELQQAGVPAAIEAGKVKIRETKTVVKKGQVISKKVADVLGKLDIKPMDVGLRLQAAFYESTVYRPEMLAIDEDAIRDQMVLAARQAFNLSLFAAIPTKETAPDLLAKAVREARSLAVEANIYDKDVIELLLGKAQRESVALESIAGKK